MEVRRWTVRASAEEALSPARRVGDARARLIGRARMGARELSSGQGRARARASASPGRQGPLLHLWCARMDRAREWRMGTEPAAPRWRRAGTRGFQESQSNYGKYKR